MLLMIVIAVIFNPFYIWNNQTQKVSRVEISGIKSFGLDAAYPVQIDKGFSDVPVSIHGERFKHSILAHAYSLIYFEITKGKFKYFKAKLGLDDAVGTRGEVGFVVYLDGQPAFVSPIIRGGDQAVPLLLDISRSQKIELVVDSLTDNSYDQAVWAEPEFMNNVPSGWSLSLNQSSLLKYSREQLKLYPNQNWDTGLKAFPNKTGLLWWQIIAAVIYLLLFVTLYFQRQQLFSLLSATIRYLARPEAFVLLLTAILAFQLFAFYWKAGLPASWDANGHYVRCWLLKNVFLSNFRLDGWSPYWYFGCQQFLFYSILLSFLVVLLHFLTFQVLPLLVCFKIFYFLAFVCLPFACYWLMRQYDVEPLPSAFAALGTLSFSALHGIGIEGLFISGLLTQSFGLIIFCIALGLLKRLENPTAGLKDTLFLALGVGIVFIGHTITSIYFIFCLMILLALNIFNIKYVTRTIIAFFVGVLLASFALWPTFYFQDLKGGGVGWGEINFLEAFLKGNYFSSQIINIMALLGGVVALFQRKKKLWHLVALAVLTCLVASGKFMIGWGRLSDISQEIFKSRSYPYLAIYLIVFSGVFYQLIIKMFVSLEAKARQLMKKNINLLVPLLIFCLFLLVTISSIQKIAPLSKWVRLDTDFNNLRNHAYLDAFNWLRINTPQNIVVVFDTRMKDVGDIGYNHFSGHINIYADRYSLHGDGGRSNYLEIDGHLADWSPEKIFDGCRRYNVSYLYTWNEDVLNNLSAMPDLFHPVFQNYFVTIWQVIGHDFRYLENDNIKIKQFYFSPEEVRWEVVNEKQNNLVTAAISYHPNWKLFINGRSSEIGRTSDNLIAFNLPRVNTNYQIELIFKRTLLEKIFYFTSAITLLGIIFFLNKRN